MNRLQDLFSIILNMSITASFVILGVILVRLLLRKAPKIFSYVLWAIVFFRLVCPFSFTSDFSFIGLVKPDIQKHASISGIKPYYTDQLNMPAIQSGIDNPDNLENNPLLLQASPSANENTTQAWMGALSVVWIAGVAAFLIYSIIAYVKIKGKLQTATLIEDNIYETDAISTAFVFGFIRPKIYVPVNVCNSDAFPCILEHENVHIRRRDYLIKPLAYLSLVLHWFNPLVWLSFMLMSRDMEMSCDESVLTRMGSEAKRGYSSSLLSLSVVKSGLLTANPLAFGESHVKSRIKNILNYRKPSFWVLLIAVTVICTAVVIFASNPKNNTANETEQVTNLAWQVINRDIANYESNPRVRIIDSKITRLELIESFDALADTPIDVYALEYRLLPEDLSKVVLAGGMQVDEEGWLTERSSMGSPLLVVSRKGLSVELLGTLWTGEISGKEGLETAVKDLLKRSRESEIQKLVEENLAVIMSSPKESSNPYAYILAHQVEYENIKKFGGEEALQYMLSQFESGNSEGLRGYIMMYLCKDLLGARNNVTNEYLSPQEWYAALHIKEEIKLPDFVYDGNDPIEKLVYITEVNEYSDPQEGFTIVAPRIFGSYEEGSSLKVFVTTYSITYRLYGNVLDDVSGSIIPAAITYKKDSRGNYVLAHYEQAQDGSYFAPSIRKFCTMPVSGKEIPGLADKILEHYGNRDDIFKLMAENLYKHLKANGITDAVLYGPKGKIEFSMKNPPGTP